MISTTVIPNKEILNVDVYHKEGDKTLGYEQLLYDFCACTGVNYDENIYKNLINLECIIIFTDEELSSINTFLPESISGEQKTYLENLRNKGLFENFEYLGFHTYGSSVLNINSIQMKKNLLLDVFYEKLNDFCTKSTTR